MSFGSALIRPYTNLKNLILGLIITLVPILNFATTGYGLRCAVSQDRRSPNWSEFGKLWVDGLLALIITIIWGIPLAIVTIFTLGSTFVAMLADPTAAVSALGGGMILLVIVGLLTAYILPVALINFALNGFGGGFAFGTIFRKAFSGQWFVKWILALIAGIIIYGIATVLQLALDFTVVLPFIISVIAGFTATVTSMSILGEAF